jgi:3'-5' exoribonuclease
MQVCEFADGCEVSQVLLVRELELRTRRAGGEYLKLTIGDRTGSVPAVIWDEVLEARQVCVPGDLVHATGRYCVHPRFGPQLTITALRPARDGEYDPGELVDGPARSPEQMEADLRELLSTVQDSYLQRLLDEVFGEGSATWSIYRDAPAAKRYHQAYRHGLLEHSR